VKIAIFKHFLPDLKPIRTICYMQDLTLPWGMPGLKKLFNKKNGRKKKNLEK